MSRMHTHAYMREYTFIKKLQQSAKNTFGPRAHKFP